MYAAYLLESQSKHMLETPHGFLTYGFNCVPGVSFPHVYIVDLYVIPSARKTRVASEMADKVADIARERGITKMIGSVGLENNGSDTSLRVLQGYGMKLYAATAGAIWMIKDI